MISTASNTTFEGISFQSRHFFGGGGGGEGTSGLFKVPLCISKQRRVEVNEIITWVKRSSVHVSALSFGRAF